MHWSNKKEVLIEVSSNGRKLRHAAKELKKDKEIVMTTVSNDGTAIEYVSEILRNDEEVILTAIATYPFAFKYASEYLQNDKELLLLLERDNRVNFNVKWYIEKMAILDMYREKEELEKIIKNTSSKTKAKKF